MKGKKIFFGLDFSNVKVRRIFVISVAVILVLVAAVGTTLAFIATKTDGVKNVFDPVTIECSVSDDYRVKNEGDYDAYIRAYYVVNWVDANGNVYGQPPVENTDYTLVLNATDVNGSVTANSWEIGSDDFYYYTSPVPPTGSDVTTALVSNVSLKTTAPDGYELQVQMIAEAIQAKPIDTINSNWGVQNNGTLIYK